MVQASQTNVLRKFGIELVGVVPWGTHLCQFYESKQDLIDILVPYFAEGLRANEFCMWVTSPPLEVEEAKEALKKAVPNLDEYFRNEQIEIVSYNDWYMLDGKFDADRVLQGWADKETAALKRGFDGARLTGNTLWLERHQWNSYVDYEATVNALLGKHRILGLCSYSLKNCSGTDVLDAECNHESTLIKRGSRWVLMEDAAQRKMNEKSLKESEERFSKAFHASPHAISIQRASDCCFVDVNENFLRLFEYNKEEVIGHNLAELNMIVEPEKYAYMVRLMKERNSVHDIEIVDRTKSGKLVNVLISTEIINLTGQEHYLTTLTDITERKKAEQELWQIKNDWERTFDNIPDFIAILDTDYKIVRVNRAMAQQLGVTPEDAKGLICYEHVHGTISPPEFCPHARSLRDSKEHTAEVHEPRLGGDFIVSVTPLFNKKGEMVGTVHVARNITERKRMEAELEKHAKHLEILVEEKTKQLKDAERFAAIGQTAGMVGHDIRNPLQAITGDVYLTKSDLDFIPDSKAKEGIKESLVDIEQNVEYINKIVADLQDYAKPIKPATQETDLESLCQEALLKKGIPENIDVSCQVEEEAKILVSDSEMLKRILSNLLSNAVQAMPDGGKLIIHTCQDHGDIVITIQDTGVGIPEEIKPKLFTPLFTTKSKGQGFGLAVVKRLIEALGGIVTFESEVGKGTKFILRFPPKTNKR